MSLPAQFSNGSILILNPESVGLMSPNTMTTAGSEFHSFSFTVRKVDLDIDDCIIIQLTETWQHNVV